MVTKITYDQMVRNLIDFNRINGVTSPGSCKGEIKGVVVVSQDNWDEKYSLGARSYVVSSSNKAFIDGMCGYSIFASTLDGSDSCRLENYLETERGSWKIDYCYMLEEPPHTELAN